MVAAKASFHKKPTGKEKRGTKRKKIKRRERERERERRVMTGLSFNIPL